MSYTLQRATLKDALLLNARLTVADRQELHAGDHVPLESIIWGLEHSLRPLSIFDKEGRLAAIAGVVPQDRHFFEGAPWMLTTDSAGTEPIAFVKQAQEWVDTQSSQFKVLRNEVYKHNMKHVRLLRILGFTVDEPKLPTQQFLPFRLFRSSED